MDTLEPDDVHDILAAVAADEPRKEIAAKFDISPATVRTLTKKLNGLSEDQIDAQVRRWGKYKKIFRAIFDEKFNREAAHMTETTVVRTLVQPHVARVRFLRHPNKPSAPSRWRRAGARLGEASR